MNPQPFISIIIPAFNEESRIARCLEALQKLAYPREKFEIIVVDNGSTDATAQVASQHGARVVSYTQTQGVSGTRQAGAEAASGEIIAYTDADSAPKNDWLNEMARLFENEKIVAVGGEVKPLQGNLVKNFLYELYHYFLLANQFLGKVLPWGSNLAVRASALREVGGFNINLRTSEDWDLSLRLQKKFGHSSVIYSSTPLVYASTRKQDNWRVFLGYLLDGLPGYLSVLLFGRAKSAKMRIVR